VPVIQDINENENNQTLEKSPIGDRIVSKKFALEITQSKNSQRSQDSYITEKTDHLMHSNSPDANQIIQSTLNILGRIRSTTLDQNDEILVRNSSKFNEISAPRNS
jgi:hypothetical protein